MNNPYYYKHTLNSNAKKNALITVWGWYIHTCACSQMYVTCHTLIRSNYFTKYEIKPPVIRLYRVQPTTKKEDSSQLL